MKVAEQTLPDEGRLRGPLVVCALVAYLVAGGTRIAGEPPAPLWWLAWLVFGGAMVAALLTRMLSRARALFAVQSAAALGLLALGMPHFEGALLALVAAQSRRVLPLRAAVLVAVAIPVPHFVAILASHGVLGSLKASGELLVFGLFCVAAYEMLWRERDARRAQERISKELLETRQRLAEATRLGEQARIGRDLHDELGYHLEILRDRLGREHTDAASLAALDALAASVRRAIGGLPEPAPADLVDELRTLAQSLPAVRVEIDAQGGAQVPTAVSRTLLRVAQETLTNAARHAHEPSLRWELRTDAGLARLVSTGRGSPREGSAGTGRGLLGLEARVQSQGGRFEARAEQEAFVVEVSLPLEAP